ncbi:MAG: Ni/Fe-hydrogenase cytochrome b subunit [Xanthobacteraceae bacterium]
MQDAHAQPRPLGGRILTVPVAILTVLTLVGFYYIAKRYYFGIGAVANVNPGYPWGIWVAFDVIVGPAIGCGGFAMALLTYVLNHGKYHPIMRPALLGGLFGYTLAGVAVMIDLGRYFNSLNLFLPWYLNTNSIMLETALCVMAYVAVLWIEFSPAFLERFGLSRIRVFMERFMFVIIALGVLLPTMHQSALGTILAVNESKLSPLWWTQLLPVLYLISAIAMGYAIVAFEATLVSRGFRLQSELPLLSSIGRITLWLVVAFLVIRVGVITLSGDLGLAFESTRAGLLFWVETFLFVAAIALLSTDRLRRTERYIFLSACALLLGGTFYRLDSYLIVYQGTPGWRYFPSVPELMITIGLVSLHVLAFILFCKLLPVLSNPPRQAAEGHAS